MEKISKELEEKIKKMITENRLVEAVILVQKELQLGLKISKEIVDSYKNRNE